MIHETDRARYLASFFDPTNVAPDRRARALREALRARAFEIELYWKRAAYFWTLIAAVLTGYFLLGTGNHAFPFHAQFLVACIGLVFSVAWFLVNRGSKYWLTNWNNYVRLLEDDVIGPLYKSRLNCHKHRALSLTDPYPFSVTKINQILSLFLSLILLCLVFVSATTVRWHNTTHRTVALVAALLSAIFIACLVATGRVTPGTMDVRLPLDGLVPRLDHAVDDQGPR
jgi:hypothetical protein